MGIFSAMGSVFGRRNKRQDNSGMNDLTSRVSALEEAGATAGQQEVGSALFQTNERFVSDVPSNKKPRPTRQEQKNIIMDDYRGKMRQRNDSLRKLKPTDKHYLPTFDKGTDDNVNFYKDPKNKSKINALRKLSKPLRDKTQKKLRNV